MPTHYLNQWWNIDNLNLRNKLLWNFRQNSYIVIQENAFEYVIWEIASILFWPQCVNQSHTNLVLFFFFTVIYNVFIHNYSAILIYSYQNISLRLEAVLWCYSRVLGDSDNGCEINDQLALGFLVCVNLLKLIIETTPLGICYATTLLCSPNRVFHLCKN